MRKTLLVLGCLLSTLVTSELAGEGGSAAILGSELGKPVGEPVLWPAPVKVDIPATQATHTMNISSPAFESNGMIPVIYTCDGQSTPPALKFGNVPAKSKSLALIVDDPDAPMGTWVHWLIWNISPDCTGIDPKHLPVGSVQGSNSSHNRSYDGPCPPSGYHHYHFKLYALDTKLKLDGEKTSASLLEAALKGHILAKAELVGVYAKKH